MCTAQSKPMRERTGESRPTMKAVPSLFQPPPLAKEVKTCFAEAVGARTQRTVIDYVSERSSWCDGGLTNDDRKESDNVQNQK
jgi:hypothetical protein